MLVETCEIRIQSPRPSIQPVCAQDAVESFASASLNPFLIRACAFESCTCGRRIIYIENAVNRYPLHL